MADFKCINNECYRKDDCYRFTSMASEVGQSFSYFTPVMDCFISNSLDEEKE